MIEKLDSKQLKLMDKVKDHWIYTALLSDSKINKKEVMRGIHWLYKISGLEKPVVIFLDNPLHLQYGANLIKNPSQVRSQVDSQVRSQVYSQVRSQVYSQVDSQVDSQVYSQVDSQVYSQVDSQKLEVFDFGYEQLGYYAGYCAWLDFYSKVLKFDATLASDVKKYLKYMNAGPFMTIYLKGFAFVCPKPKKVYRDAQNRLHSTKKPAISWKGYELYFLDGVCLPKEWWTKIVNDQLSPEEIFAIDYLEHRRIAYQYMDKSKMLKLKDYKVLDEQTDEKGNPMKIISFNVQNMRENINFYNCFCPSTKREYFIQTNKTTCKEAKAASFGLVEVEWCNEW